MNPVQSRHRHDASARASHIAARGIGATLVLTLLAVVYPGHALAQVPAGAVESDVTRRLNPFADAMLIPATVSTTAGQSSGIRAVTVALEPRIPLRLHRNWRLVTVWDMSLTHLSGPDGTTALADAESYLFLTPARTGTWVWGVGPSIHMPVATNTDFGTGRWAGGPTAALFYVHGRWTNGVVGRYIRSFRAAGSRPDVGLAQIRWQIACDLSKGWYIDTTPTFSYDTHGPTGDRWTVPVGLDVGRNVALGSKTVGLQAGAYRVVVKPSDAAAWQVSAQVAWLR